MNNKHNCLFLNRTWEDWAPEEIVVALRPPQTNSMINTILPLVRGASGFIYPNWQVSLQGNESRFPVFPLMIVQGDFPGAGLLKEM